jgi:clan AA aspartic protease
MAEQRIWMGVTDVTGVVTGPTGVQVELKFLVDSGATLTVLPKATWKKLGLRPTRSRRFSLANGTTIERQLSECRISLPQGETATPVVLGEGGDVALLGVVTLEELGLMLNPLDRTLREVEWPLMSIVAHDGSGPRAFP